MGDDPVSVTAPADLSAATVVWRHRGKLYVTAVAKESFTLDASGGERRPPGPISRAEQDAGGGRISPDDLAPYVARADIWAVGHLRGAPGASIEVALRVRRGGALLLDKTARVVTDASGEAWLGPLGPVSKRWPARARYLGLPARPPIEGDVIAVPDAIDWAYFQTAPADQQVQWLMPGDEITLQAGDQRFFMRLPVVSPAARLVEAVHGSSPDLAARAQRPSTGHLLLMRADCLSFDLEARRADLLFRANAVLVGEPGRALVELSIEDDVVPELAGTLEVRIDRSKLKPQPSQPSIALDRTSQIPPPPAMALDRTSQMPPPPPMQLDRTSQVPPPPQIPLDRTSVLPPPPAVYQPTGTERMQPPPPVDPTRRRDR